MTTILQFQETKDLSKIISTRLAYRALQKPVACAVASAVLLFLGGGVDECLSNATR